MPSKLVIVQPAIQHYRIPVFDRLRELASGDFSLEVWGAMCEGEALGGGSRDYFHDYPCKELYIGKRPIVWHPDILNKIRAERPDVVISTVYPSHLTSWTLPKTCASVGAIAIGWTKVQSPKTRSVSQYIKRKLFDRYRYILAYSGSSRDELCSLGYPESNVFVTNNTIDTDRIFASGDRYDREAELLRSEHNLTGKRILLCISTMESHKRHEDLLAAWPQLKQIDDDLHLVLIGSGSLADQLRDQCGSLESSRIHFLGRVPAGADYGWIAAADATIQCGAVGLAINQSMAFGKPTIIADEPGPDTESLVDNETGFRYQKGNLDDLVNRTRDALSDSDVVRTVTANARKIIQEQFSMDHMVSKIHQCALAAIESQRQVA